MRFLLDNNLAPKHAKALHALVEPEHQVFHLRDKFPPNAPDEEWLVTLVNERDWIVISGDMRIARSAHQKILWQSSNLVIFFLAKGWSNLDLMTKHAKLSQCFDSIIGAATRARRGTGFIVQVNGNIYPLFEPAPD